MSDILEKEKSLTEDSFLKTALLRLRENYFTKRKKIEKLFDIETLRDEVHRIKSENIESLGKNLSPFIEKIKENAEKVVFAKNKGEALDAMLKILDENDVKKIIKSKSLTTEELELNSFLESEGFSVVETDLGEWLVQINKEKPTHMTAPAIHMSKEKVNELLKRVFDVNLPLNPKTMVDFCKSKIRESFKEADCGIIGANVASLESGRFFILSNEGNIQNVLRKKVVICVLGIDKIVGTDNEAFKIVDALPKTATGQITTSYVDVIKKPFGKFYVILLDNNRLEFSKDSVYKEILYCIHCGACQNACPVYTTVSGKLFKGKTYAGPVGLILSYLVKDTGNLWDFANMCIGCMACDEICSARINLQELILRIKAQYTPKKITPKRLIIKYLENNYHILRFGAYVSHFLFKKDLKTGISSLDRALGEDFRPLPGVNSSFDISVYTKKTKICLFAGCSVNFFYSNVGNDALQVASKLGVDLSVIKQRSCCGAPAWYNGEEKSAKEAAKINVEFLKSLNCDKILFLDPHCAHMVKRDYVEFLNTNDAKSVSDRVSCAGSFFLNLLKNKGVKTSRIGAFISYHHPCHLRRGLKQSNELEEFLKANEPNFVELKDKDRCCGFAGSYSLMHPYISSSLLDEKLDNIKNTGAQVLVTACPGCMMQIGGGLKARKSFVEVLHFVSYLNRILIKHVEG